MGRVLLLAALALFLLTQFGRIKEYIKLIIDIWKGKA